MTKINEATAARRSFRNLVARLVKKDESDRGRFGSAVAGVIIGSFASGVAALVLALGLELGMTALGWREYQEPTFPPLQAAGLAIVLGVALQAVGLAVFIRERRRLLEFSPARREPLPDLDEPVVRP
jgi:O-antigen ligase